MKSLLLLLIIISIKYSNANYNISNILMIIVDDLRPEIGAFVDTDEAYYPNIQTPHLDSLAADSIVFRNAYTQYPKCGPSRNSFLTGRRPDTTQTFRNGEHWREQSGNFTSLPQYFKDNGYLTYASGKVFHYYGLDDDYSWSEDNYGPNTTDFWHRDGLSWGIAQPEVFETIPLPCMQIRDYTIQKLRQVSTEEQSFFIAVGFEKPHLPFLAPQEFFDLYPENDIYLPQNPHVPLNYPGIAWSYWGDLIYYEDIQEYDNSYNMSLPDNKTLDLRRAYYASVSYTDSLIGEVLQELVNLGLEENTAVMFFSDHGWHLGEHSTWAKQTNLYLDNHVPMMLKIPGVTDGGLLSDAFVENVDIFSTLVDVAGIPPVELCPEDSSQITTCTEGLSMMGLISQPVEWKSASFSQYQRDDAMSYSIFTHEYHYVKWVSYVNGTADWENIIAEELYDSTEDPNETENVAGYPEYEDVQIDMEERLEAGWRDALP